MQIANPCLLWRIVIAVGFSLLLAGPVLAANLTVNVESIHPGNGTVRVALYNKPQGFRHEENAIAVLSAPATAQMVSVNFPDIAPGRYAVIAYHDENDDRKLNLRLGMFPMEGWGLSNNPNVMGPPRYEASAFNVTNAGFSCDVVLHY